MDDLISRQAALNIRFSDAINEDGVLYVPLRDFTDGLKALPSAQPERKKGKWIDAVIPNDNGDLLVQVCDQCNVFFPLAYTGGGHHFCPNCGADMRGEQNE